MTLSAFPDFGDFVYRRRQRQRIDFRRAADHADHQGKLADADLAKAQRRSFVPAVAVEAVARDCRHFPGWVDALLDPVELAGCFQARQIFLQVVMGHEVTLTKLGFAFDNRTRIKPHQC